MFLFLLFTSINFLYLFLYLRRQLILFALQFINKKNCQNDQNLDLFKNVEKGMTLKNKNKNLVFTKI